MTDNTLLLLLVSPLLFLVVAVLVGEAVWRKRFVERAASKDNEREGVEGDGT